MYIDAVMYVDGGLR